MGCLSEIPRRDSATNVPSQPIHGDEIPVVSGNGPELLNLVVIQNGN